MQNMSIREAAKNKSVKLWEIAEKLGTSDSSFSRCLRKPLSEEETARILSIIDGIAAEHKKSEANK